MSVMFLRVRDVEDIELVLKLGEESVERPQSRFLCERGVFTPCETPLGWVLEVCRLSSLPKSLGVDSVVHACCGFTTVDWHFPTLTLPVTNAHTSENEYYKRACCRAQEPR